MNRLILTSLITTLLFCIPKPALAWHQGGCPPGTDYLTWTGTLDGLTPAQWCHLHFPTPTPHPTASPTPKPKPTGTPSSTPTPRPSGTPTAAPTPNPTNANTNNNSNSQNQQQQQQQSQNQSQTANGGAGGNAYSSSASGASASNVGNSQTVNVDNRQAVPLPGFVQSGTLCATPSVAGTIGSGGQYAVGVSIPLFTHPKDCRPNTERERIDRCIQYLQAGIVVSSVNCVDVHFAPPAATPTPVAVVTPFLVSSPAPAGVVTVPKRCATIDKKTKKRLLAEIHQLRKTKYASQIAADLKLLREACVSDKELATAIDG